MLTSHHQALRAKIIHHPVYSKLQTVSDLCVFMEHHIVAVWDFMTLLKSLQVMFTCVSIPWVPTEDPIIRRMINEITLAEESDTFGEGIIASHYEFYVQAMKRAGANTQPIESLVNALKQGVLVDQAISESQLPDCAKEFTKTTLALIATQKWHCIAASFAYTREGLIPDMFDMIVKNVSARFPNKLDLFINYLNRHIELDGDVHGILADQMVKRLCANDPQKIAEAQAAITQSLEARLSLWNGAEKKLKINL